MSKIIISNIDSIIPNHVNEHNEYEYRKYEVTDGRHKYEVSSPNEGNQTVMAFYTLPPGKSNYPFHFHSANEMDDMFD